jgi:hypothetical protein
MKPMTANKQKVNAAQKAIACALESGSLSKDKLVELARKFGLGATQEAAGSLDSTLAKRQETLSKHIDVLFSDKTAKALGEWPRPADYRDPQPYKPRRKAA